MLLLLVLLSTYRWSLNSLDMTRTCMVSLEEFRYSVEREFVVDTTIRADLAAIELLPIFAKQWCKKPEFGFLNSALQKRVRTNPVSMFFVKDMGIAKNGLPFSRSGTFRGLMRSDKFYTMLDLDRVESVLAASYMAEHKFAIDGQDLPPLVLGPIECMNYCHWVTEALPKVLLYKSLLGVFPREIWTVGKKIRFQEESLSMLSSETRLRSIDSEAVRLPWCAISTSLAKSVSEIHPLTFDLLRRFSASERFECNGRRIYLSRAKARFRRVVNESELISALQPYGFEVVVAEDLSFRDQVELFSGSELIVAPHGAGLANLSFARAAKLLVEIFSPGFGASSAFAHICRHKNIKYAAVVGFAVAGTKEKVAGPGSWAGNRDFYVNPEEVLRYIG